MAAWMLRCDLLRELSKPLKAWRCFPEYVEREDSIEIVRVLRGGQDLNTEATKI